MKRPLVVGALLVLFLVIVNAAPLRHIAGAFGVQALTGMLRNSLLPLLAAAFLCACAWGTGRRLLRATATGAEEAERDAAAFALGAGLWATALLLLGLSGLFTPAAVLATTAVVALAAWPECPRLRPGLPRIPTLSWGRLLAAGVLALAGWHVLVHALAPPTDADALAYHLALPDLYLEWGEVRRVPWIIFSHWPHLVSILYAVPLTLGLDNVAALMHAAAAAALVAAVFRVAREEFDAPTAWTAAAILAVQPALVRFAGTPRIEAWWALLHFLAFHSAWRWGRDGGRVWLLRAALLAGLAASVKLIGLASLAILGVWILLRGKPSERVRCAAMTLGIGAAVASPWLLATWAATGSPIWPYLGGDGYLAERFSRLNVWPAWTDLTHLLRNGPQYLLVPAALAALGSLRSRSGLPPYLRFHAATFVPYALLVAWNYEAWRYCVPWMPALALLIAWGAVRLWRRGGIRRAGAALLAGCALYPLLALNQSNALFAVLELRSNSHPDLAPREVYLRRTFPPYAAFRAATRRFAGAPVRIFLFHESMGYYLDTDYLWGSPSVQGLVRYDELADGEALRERLRDLGVTHVLVRQPMPGYYERRAAILARRMLRRSSPLLRERDHVLYAL